METFRDLCLISHLVLLYISFLQFKSTHISFGLKCYGAHAIFSAIRIAMFFGFLTHVSWPLVSLYRIYVWSEAFSLCKLLCLDVCLMILMSCTSLISCKVKLSESSLRVPRAETRLTVHRPLQVSGAPQLLAIGLKSSCS